MKRFTFRRSRLVVAVAVVLLAMPVSIHSASAADNAEAFVQSVGRDVVDVLKSTRAGSEDREKKLRQIFVEAFDSPTIARFVMGRHWRRLDDADRKRYLQVFPGYVAAIYATRFAEYGGQTFNVARSRPVGEKDIFVDTEIRGAGQTTPVAVGIRVRQAPAGLKMVDVTVEGISLLVTKREEFNTFLNRQSASTLIDRLAAIAKS